MEQIKAKALPDRLSSITRRIELCGDPQKVETEAIYQIYMIYLHGDGKFPSRRSRRTAPWA